jgi:hypothetical protein
MSDETESIVFAYELSINKDHLNQDFSEQEKRLLRPIAETLAMMDGNAFFTVTGLDGKEWYEHYLPESYALYTANGGPDGWAGECCWIREMKHENDSVREAYENWHMLKKLSKG